MEKIFEYSSPREHYHNKEAFLWCCDQRFDAVRNAFMKAGNFQMPDPILLPGGAKVLAMPENPRDRDFVLDQIGILMGHGFGTLYVMAHNECAACGGNTDRAFYEEMLRKAGETVSARFPTLHVKLVYADFDGLYQL